MPAPTLLAIDQGTTSSRAILFDRSGHIVDSEQAEFAQIYPHSGWVEHDPESIWATTLRVCREVLARADQVAAIGIANQRETTVVWERATGRPIANAIVWQDRRTADVCESLRAQGHEDDIRAKTGLLLDPYFSATKIAWLLDSVEGARARAEAGELAAGTIDSFLIWRLTGGKVHATDATNASRTSLFNIHSQNWDESLLALFRVPLALLPQVLDCAADYGTTDVSVLGQAIGIRGVAGDQQAASIGQACFEPGMIKSTYGTGCFALINTGNQAPLSRNRLLTTIAYRLEGQATYALEGSIFVAGAAVQWLRDGLGIVESAPQTEAMASKLDSNGGVYLVPAFTGLAAPWWDPHARGAIFGIARDTGPAHLARAALESVCYQSADLLTAMAGDGTAPESLRVDGGMVGNDWLLQFLADVLDIPVERPVITETTALGAAYLAGLQAGVYQSFSEISAAWQCDARFEPRMAAVKRADLLASWHGAVDRVRGTRLFSPTAERGD